MSATEARRRHPSTQPPVHGRRVAAELTRLLGRAGVPWPQVAAAVLQLRGRAGVSPDDFAGRLGIAPDVVRRAEAGELGVGALPEPLRGQVRRVLLDAAPRWSA